MNLLNNVWGNSTGKHFISIKPLNGEFRNIPVTGMDEVDRLIAQHSDNADMYFACSTFNEDGGRKQSDSKEAASYWLDIDCGSEKPYATKTEGAKALRDFCEVTGLPIPTIVDSGNGIHCYWPLNKPMPREVWRPIADKLKVLTQQHGFKVDDNRTADEASVMRLPGSMNLKDPENPKAVRILRDTGVFDSNEIIAKIEAAYANTKRDPKTISGAANDDIVGKLVVYMADKEPRLHAGEWKQFDTGMGVIGYPSQSEADYSYTAVCVRKLDSLGVSREEMAEIALEVFKSSGLYRDDRKALLAINKHIDALPERSVVTDKRERVQLKLSDGKIQLSDIPPPPREFVWEDLLPAGKTTLLAGAGGVSKTQQSIQLMVSVAAGMGLFSRKVMMGSTLGIFAEDDPDELARRINATLNTLNLSAKQKSAAAERIRALSMIGLDSRITKPINGCLESTGFADEIARLAEELAAETGEPVRLIVIDHASLIHGGDFNSREDVAQTGRLINHIANVTGAAILLLAHTRKGASTKEDEPSADDAAGSAAWSDLVRSVVVIRTMTEKEGQGKGVSPDKRKEYASLTVVKANYAPPSSPIWLHRRSVEGWGVGVLTEVDLKPKAKPMPGADMKLRGRITNLVKCFPNLTRTGILIYAGRDGDLKASKGKVTAEVDAMLLAGELMLVDPTEEEKKRLKIKGQTAGFLRIGKEES